MRLFIPVTPMGAVRMTGRGKWVSPTAQKYLDYKTAVAWEAKQQAKLEVPISNPIIITEITFVMPIPSSGYVERIEGGKRKRRRVNPGEYHIGKPDIDNLFKGVTDSLSGIVWEDDSLICEVGRQAKIYGEQPRIEIEIEEVSA